MSEERWLWLGVWVSTVIIVCCTGAIVGPIWVRVWTAP